jgi:ribose transport system ATP-binding protein
MNAPLVEMRGISKTYPGVRALDEVSLSLYPGEVHMLVGQNGAGKSTLIKALCGADPPDQGEFLFDGRPVRIHSPADARRLGIAVIFQELSLVPYLDLAQNIYLGRELRGPIPGLLDHRRMHAAARRLLETLGTPLDTRTPAHRLGIAQQQIVEIAKALSQDARVVVMDEPTSALSEPEIVRLFDVIRTLKAHGVAVLYVSHRLREVLDLGDRITLLRDGRTVGSLKPSETKVEDLVRMMVGREVSTTYRHRFCEHPGEPLLQVRGVDAENGVRDATLSVRAGEIVGLAGLVGAGRSELARAIFGADRVTAGTILVAGQPIEGSPESAVAHGVGLVPENRKTEGLALMRTVRDNLLAAALARLFPTRWYRPARATQIASDTIARLRVATPSPHRPVRMLSGGNQQKVVVGKWLTTGARVFIFDEPTRSIDVGAKTEIYRLMEGLVEKGAAVLMISSELPEVVAVCDRAYVMRDKRIVGELGRGDLTEENILRLAMHQ